MKCINIKSIVGFTLMVMVALAIGCGDKKSDREATGLTDYDSDGYPDLSDNCPMSFNPDQSDIDGDGFGDECDGSTGDVDTDGDGYLDGADNCPKVYNPSQADADGDGVGDKCDNDKDGDGFTEDGGDCDDMNANINPDASEMVDGVDNNCDGEVDKGSIKAVGAGYGYSCLLEGTGRVRCWGNDLRNQVSNVPIPSAVNLSVGISHSCIINNDKKATCWGSINHLEGVQLGEYRFAKMASGVDQTCGIKEDGSVECFGMCYTLVGDQYRKNCEMMNFLGVPEGEFIDISLNNTFNSCGVRSDKSLTCWGGDPTVINPNMVSIVDNVPLGEFFSVGVGQFHACGLLFDGSVICWGENDKGQSEDHPGRFVKLSVGIFHNCGLKADGTALCWGDNENGQTDVPEGKYKDISAGATHTCGIKVDDSVVCWGSDKFGELSVPQ